MSLIDPYGLTLVSVEVWGIVMAFTSLGFIVGGILVARRGLGPIPSARCCSRTSVMWIVRSRSQFGPRCCRSRSASSSSSPSPPWPSVRADDHPESRAVPRQGRVFGFGQSIETAASPITAFLIGPIAQFWIIPSMTNGSLAASIGRGSARGRNAGWPSSSSWRASSGRGDAAGVADARVSTPERHVRVRADGAGRHRLGRRGRGRLSATSLARWLSAVGARRSPRSGAIEPHAFLLVLPEVEPQLAAVGRVDRDSTQGLEMVSVTERYRGRPVPASRDDGEVQGDPDWVVPVAV